jgi:hypothetical protein
LEEGSCMATATTTAYKNSLEDYTQIKHVMAKLD